MKGCIIAIGSELLTPFRVDTNSLFITERLNEIGMNGPPSFMLLSSTMCSQYDWC